MRIVPIECFLIALALTAVPIDSFAAAQMPDTAKMNVLFIIAEDWSANTPGCYGK